MSDSKIKPEKITKPIQLLAAWLIGLIVIVGSLLAASGTVLKPDWLPAFYGISAVAIIPIFLLLIFLLQTKYRPQIQEDEYYSKYLDKNTMQFVDIKKDNLKKSEWIKQEMDKILIETQESIESIKESIEKNAEKDTVEKIVSLSDNKIKNLEKIVRYSAHNLWINKTLDTFPQILNSIKKIGFNNYNEFGETKIPGNFLVSFTDSVDPVILKDILIELIPFGACSIGLIDKDEVLAENYGKTIFIGSYLYNKPDLVIIDQKVLNKINLLNENSLVTNLMIK